MKTIDPNLISVSQKMAIITGAVSPRPIAFAGTIDKEGNPNLSPFSFYNSFGSNPPILVFSPARRGRDNTVKDTYLNVKEVPEVVINTVSYSMVEQMNLASAEYPKGTDEYVKSGFTPIKSELIRPFRVKESPVQFECKVINIIETGTSGGAGIMIVCEILLIHLNEDILDENGIISPYKIDLIGRMGADYYTRISPDSVFSIEKPLNKLGIGFDSLPEEIKNSNILTGNDLAKLAGLAELPNSEKISEFIKSEEFCKINTLDISEKHKLAKQLLDVNRRIEALNVLLS